MKSIFQTVQSGEDNDTICSKCDSSDINTEWRKLIGDVKLIYWFRSPTTENDLDVFLDNGRKKLAYSEAMMKKAMPDLSLEGEEGRKNVQMEKDPRQVVQHVTFSIYHYSQEFQKARKRSWDSWEVSDFAKNLQGILQNYKEPLYSD